MKILTFDVGVKNLAYCYFEYEGKTTIVGWNNLKVTEKNCNKLNLEELSEDLLSTLYENFDENFEADVVLIENQPLLKNGFMKTVSVMIYTYFSMMKLQYGTIREVQFTSAMNKLKCKKAINLTSSKTTYKERKDLSILVAKSYIEEMCPEKLDWFNSQKKLDDLSDALLFGLYYIEKKEMASV